MILILIYQNSTRKIAIYQLEQDIPIEEIHFDEKKGDIIVGGGHGEAESLRISKKGIEYFTINDSEKYEKREELVKPFWTPTFAYKLGNGLIKLNWTPDENMEFWFAKKIVNILLEHNKI